MSRAPAPILSRSLRDALRSHPMRSTLRRLTGFVEQVLVPKGDTVGVVLTGDCSVYPRMELISVVEGAHERPPCSFSWARNEDEEPLRIELRWWSSDRLIHQPWPEGVKFALSQGVLLWDDHSRLFHLLERRLWYPDALRRHRLLDNAIQLEDLLGDGAVQAWVNRGELLQSHYLVTTALDRTLDHLFDFHQIWRPPPGRRLVALGELEWLPPHFEERLETALTRMNPDAEAVFERKAAVEAIFESIQSRVEEEAWWPAQPYQQWHATLNRL